MTDFRILLIVFIIGCILSALITFKIISIIQKKKLAEIQAQYQFERNEAAKKIESVINEKNGCQIEISRLNSKIADLETDIENLHFALRHREELSAKNEKDLLIDIHERIIKSNELNIDDFKQQSLQKKIDESISKIDWSSFIQSGLKQLFGDPNFSRTVAEGIVNDERFSEAIRDVNTLDESDIETAVENVLTNMEISSLSSSDVESALENAFNNAYYTSGPGYGFQGVVENALSGLDIASKDDIESAVSDAISNRMYDIESTIESAVSNAMNN